MSPHRIQNRRLLAAFHRQAPQALSRSRLTKYSSLPFKDSKPSKPPLRVTCTAGLYGSAAGIFQICAAPERSERK